MASVLFSPLSLRGVTFKNRIFVSPMCQYSSLKGAPQAWHMVHLGSRAIGGAACVIQEATTVTPEGRISPTDAGLWNDTQAEAYAPITRFIRENGSVPGIQLAHAGRKASVQAPFDGGKPLAKTAGAWEVVGPSDIAYNTGYPTPRTLSVADIRNLVKAFADATRRALKAGYELVEIHAAHGYLLHEFLSPFSNSRTDDYGGSLENRMRFPLEVAAAVRAAWPDNLPLFVRISASDWREGGWDVPDSIEFSKRLKALGVDLIDCSSGGNLPHSPIPQYFGYQVHFAAEVRKGANVPTGAVGLITGPEQADQIIASGRADIVLLAREMLRDPYWPRHAAAALGVEMPWPKQYERAAKR